VLGPWQTWTAFAHECGMSRLWGGVHFMAAITAGHNLCHPIGELCYAVYTISQRRRCGAGQSHGA
jgi:hypothetical protein